MQQTRKSYFKQRKSYKILAFKFHPDKNQESPDATNNFQRLQEAYQILSNSEKRRLYDQTGLLNRDT